MKNIEFDTKRQELLDLLDEADRVCNEVTDELDKSQDFSTTFNKLRQDIDKTRKRCRESLFEIVLIAAFQSGKSTTINAFCDGREVAPRGLAGGGIKTSACIVKIQNTDSNDEVATINWRTLEDLMLRLDEVLGGAACQISSELQDIKDKWDDEKEIKQKERYEQEYYAKIDIKTPEGQSILEEALSFELKNYNDNPGGYNEERLSLLQFAMIVLAYHNHEKLLHLQNRDTFQLEEIENYLKFPNSFQKRWLKILKNKLNVSDEFEFEEVVYAFIEEATCKINSDNLRKTGTAVVDAPGLFVSTYDTRVAIGAMQKSSAIFFFSDGEKQLDESSIKSLKSIKDANYQDKVFFGINYKKKQNLIKKEIEAAILTELNRIEFPQTELLYFNAFLALRAMQGEKILSNTLDKYSQQMIIDEAKEMCEDDYDEVTDAWLDTTEEIVRRVFTKELRDKFLDIKKEQGLCHEIIQVVMAESGWLETTDKIKDYVVRKKSYSVLVDQGCQPIIENLKKDVESVLKQTEANAQKRKEEAEAEWNDAKEKLERFYSESDQILQAHIKDSWDSILADNFWDKALIPSAKDAGQTAGYKIADEANVLGMMKQGVWTSPVNYFINRVNNFTTGLNLITGFLDDKFQKTEFRKFLTEFVKFLGTADVRYYFYLLTIAKLLNDKYLRLFSFYFHTLIQQRQFLKDKINIDVSIATNIPEIKKLEELQEKCQRIIRSELQSQLEIRTQGWFNSLKPGDNETYQEVIQKNIVVLCTKLRDKWRDIRLDENIYLEGLDAKIPHFTGIFTEDFEKSIKDIDFESIPALKAIRKAGKDFSIFTGSFVFLLGLDLLFPGVGIVLFTLSIFVLQIFARLAYQGGYKQNMAEEISKILVAELSKEQDQIKPKIKEKVSLIRLFYLQSTRNQLTYIKKPLNQRIEKAQVEFSKSQEERDKAAEIATKIRTQKVEPLRKKVEEFKQTVPKS